MNNDLEWPHYIVWNSDMNQWFKEPIKHPDLEWAKAMVRYFKGDRVTYAELDTLRWNSTMNCYLMEWKGMILGIETDGHMHS
jgi:hypothetical protein